MRKLIRYSTILFLASFMAVLAQQLLNLKDGGLVKAKSDALLTIDGSASVAASGTLSLDSDSKLYITGNLRNDGTISHTSSTVFFSGNESATISGANETRFANMSLDKQTGGNLVIAGSVTIDNNIYINNGALILYTEDLLKALGNIYNSATINNNGMIEIGN